MKGFYRHGGGSGQGLDDSSVLLLKLQVVAVCVLCFVRFVFLFLSRMKNRMRSTAGGVVGEIDPSV